jgi:hypothetical protein
MTIKQHNGVQEQTIPSMNRIEVENLAKQVVIQGEKRQEFIIFAMKMLQEIGPQTEVEKDLCKKYIFLSWKLRRTIEHERYILSEQNKRLNSMEEHRILMGRMKGRRVRNIERIDLSDPGVINLTQQQYELEKRINKTLDRIRYEQQRNGKQ